MGIPTLVLVTGPAGSGKTTLAHALARTIGCPTVSRDEIKEGMVAAFPGFVPAPLDPITLHTYDVFFAAIELLLRAEVTLVAEAAFQHTLWTRGLEPLAGLAQVRVVRCRVPAEVALARAQARLATSTTRAAHADAEHLAAAAPFESLHLDTPTLDVDSTDGWQPALAAIDDFCRS